MAPAPNLSVTNFQKILIPPIPGSISHLPAIPIFTQHPFPAPAILFFS